MQKTVAVHTLGCKLNYSESSAITRLMEQDGFVKKDFDELADVYVINTCSVTDNADKICSCDIEEVNGFHSSFSIKERTRSFLKVQDGCDYNCSFCTIPMARGKSRSD